MSYDGVRITPAYRAALLAVVAAPSPATLSAAEVHSALGIGARSTCRQALGYLADRGEIVRSVSEREPPRYGCAR